MLHCTMYFNGAVMIFACWKVHFPSVNILKAGAILTGLVFNEIICKNIDCARRWGLTPPCRARCTGINLWRIPWCILQTLSVKPFFSGCTFDPSSKTQNQETKILVCLVWKFVMLSILNIVFLKKQL